MRRALFSFLLIASTLPAAALAQSSAPWPSIREFGGATPRNLDSWVGPQDYPIAALRNNQQGNVVVAFDITAAGKATNCVVEASSGATILDQVPCELIRKRARFKPASSPDGTPVSTKARYSVAFWIPK